MTGLVLTVPVYGFLQWQLGSMAFLNRMAITFVVILVVMFTITKLRPLPQPRVLPERSDFDMSPTGPVKVVAVLVIALTLVLYVIFR